MSGVELKPCGLSAGDNILVPLGTTTIGRGPFLSIADKRVSRNHAMLEIENGVFKVKPIHVNPTFFAEKGEAKLKPLKKDEWNKLSNGDRVSLTPNEHIFEVVIDDRPVQASLTQSPRSSPVKSLPKESPTKPAISEGDLEDAPSPACRKLEFNPGENNESTAEEETNGQLEEGTGQDEEEISKEDKEEDPEPAELDKEYAKPVDRKRELPEWMTNLPSSSNQDDPPPPATKPKATPKATSRAKKRGANEIDNDDDEKGTKPPAKKRAAPAPRNHKKAAPPPSHKDDDDEEDDDSDEVPPPELKKKTSARGRPTRRVSYADEDVNEDDEEYDASKDVDFDESYDDDDDGSDWEKENSHKKKGRKGQRKSTRVVKGRKRRVQHSYSDESSEEDVYIPTPTKRTSKIMSNSQLSSDEDATLSKRRTDKKNNGENSEENDEEREPCSFGAKCYRKNPSHFREFCHPGDDDYVESNSGEEEQEADEEDKPECPYGAECYRKNPDHIKQFKHSATSERPKRPTGRGRKKAGDSDEDGPNTYDYDDSFLDEEETETPKGRRSDDSDWDPAAGKSSEDASQSVKETKDDVKNKKMQKTV